MLEDFDLPLRWEVTKPMETSAPFVAMVLDGLGNDVFDTALEVIVCISTTAN